MRLVLASASPARRAVLRAAGIDPLVEVSEIDEEAVLAGLPDASPTTAVTELALAKARAVVDRVPADSLVVGCDSMLLLDGDLVGKPGDVDTARARWKAMAGQSGELVTGHAVLQVRAGMVTAQATGAATTTVRFATPSEAELEAYLASGEPLAVAGAFTLDGLGGWFVEGVDGDPSNVIGISLPLVRALLGRLGTGPTDLWQVPSRD